MPTTDQPTSQVMFWDTNKLQPNPFQPREKVIDDRDFDDLVASVSVHGILEPLVIVETPAGTHIIAGERRWRAAKKLNLPQVPVHLLKTSPRGMLEMALVENIQRVDLTTMERAQALERLKKEFRYTDAELGHKIGKSREYVAYTLCFLRLPDPVKDGLNQGLITEGHAKALLGIPDRHELLRCYRQIIAEKASVRRAEEIARQGKRRVKKDLPDYHPALPPEVNLDKYIGELQKYWQEQSASRATIQIADSARLTKISIILRGAPDSRRQDLERFSVLTYNLDYFTVQSDQKSATANKKKPPGR